MTNRRLIAIAIAVAVLMAVAIGYQGADQVAEAGAGGVVTTTASAVADETSAEGARASTERGRFSDLPTVSVFELPPEAMVTIELIDLGGPYPFDRDDLIFENREGLLPDRVGGHYREYTVMTPGEDDRGARRIVAGDDGERYYTADHYRSFAEILFERG